MDGGAKVSDRRVSSIALTAHPSTSNDAVRGFAVQVRAEEPGTLEFQYSLKADMSRVRVPASGAAERGDALWKHTCFEAFVAPAAAPGYHEFNFSPSLEWAIYRFDAYREAMSPVDGIAAPEITVRRDGEELDLRSRVHLADLVQLRDVRHLRIALAAVIEGEGGRLSYWALQHPPGKPDFHHPHGFILEVALP